MVRSVGVFVLHAREKWKKRKEGSKEGKILSFGHFNSAWPYGTLFALPNADILTSCFLSASQC